MQPTDKNQITAFWKVVETNPGPVFAAIIFLSIAERKFLLFCLDHV